MAVCSSLLRLVLLWWLIWEAGCDTQHHGEEVELIHSDKQTRLGWISEPSNEWSEIRIKAGTPSPVPVLQACGKRVMRTVLSPWMECKDAHYLLMDIAIAQEEELPGPLSPLQVYLFDLQTPIKKINNMRTVLHLKSPKPFSRSVPPAQIFSHLNHTLALNLGSITRGGFQLAFSYSGTCVFVTSIRLYYRICPELASGLILFKSTGAGSGLTFGSCVKGAVEGSPPSRVCNMDGTWGPLQGGCTCKHGHEEMDNTCQACRMGYYKAANETGGCQICPINTWTITEGSEKCECHPGFSRLPSDHHHLGCTKPPSAPVNLTAWYHNSSVLTVMWDPPHDLGGRKEVKYRVTCERKTEASSRWKECGNNVVFLQDSEELTNKEVNIVGLNPWCDYRVSVQAWNDISTLQEESHPSTATIVIHRRKSPPLVTETPGLNVTSHELTPTTLQQSHLSKLLTIGVVTILGILLLTLLISIAVCAWRKNYSKLRSDHEMVILPPRETYCRQQMVGTAPPQPNIAQGGTPLLERIGGRLLANLKEVLVERNQLTLGKELGKGEYGSVYAGVFTPEEGIDIKVAVKTIRVGIHCQEDLHEFLKEAEIMKNFDHENVVKLLGVALESDQDSLLPVPLVILPYMKHGDLRRFLIATRYGENPLSVPHQVLLQFLIDIAAGMDYLSSRGFLHRDLAARNCMLGDDLRVCVADFGLSKKIYGSNYYRQKAVIRMPIKWMAMESLSESIFTTKSDVWSFGVTMWEIVSRGMTPYPGVHNHELLDLLQSGYRLKPPEDCDQKLYEVMQSCWEREPSMRPTFRDLHKTLKSLLSQLPVLTVSQEASYINFGLDVTDAAAAAPSQDPQTNSAERQENVYHLTLMGAQGCPLPPRWGQ
ncbi:tyrosine-protein kinase Mer isoform X2 [Melanotaenia boesemani]|uniref:tyrosine-protein kinase Mer isoform X2 n=1 Tax=Melanotaenia boesemani TaxID=1250792 RepID=UPI001C057226|nr:tyrosine-protein kinase Mer isoform X2 [Melanotaenia boesemani]